jgi:hypothetical protein
MGGGQMGGQMGGGAPQGYGAPGGAYGAPPGGGQMSAPGQFGSSIGSPGGGAMGYGAPGGMMGGGAKGQTRNPVTVLLISFVCCFYGVYQMWEMLNELQSYTNDQEFKPWYMFIPLLNYYFLWIKVPEQVTRAKQMAGSRNPQAQGIVLYIFLAPFALAKDLNEVWDPMSPGG